MQGHVEQHEADHAALRSALLGRGEPLVLDHARPQPPLDQPLAGNVPIWLTM
jgi:hypothetical protein